MVLSTQYFTVLRYYSKLKDSKLTDALSICYVLFIVKDLTAVLTCKSQLNCFQCSRGNHDKSGILMQS